jgi:hypothetical protein
VLLVVSLGLVMGVETSGRGLRSTVIDWGPTVISPPGRAGVGAGAARQS